MRGLLARKRAETVPTQANLSALIADTRADIAEMTQQYGAGLLAPSDFIEELGITLEDAHLRAGLLGRMRAGDFSPMHPDDRAFAERVMDGAAGKPGESDYLANFQRDLEGGRYLGPDGLPDTQAILRRAESYTGRVEGTAQETFALASPVGMTFHWRLGGVEDHCSRCPELAAGGPYTPEELPTFPRCNATPCRYHCKCHLVREDGVTSFGPGE